MIGLHTHEYACASGADCAALGSSDTHCAVAGGKSSYSRWSRTCRINGMAGRVLCVECCRLLGFKSVYQIERKEGRIKGLPRPVIKLEDKSGNATPALAALETLTATRQQLGSVLGYWDKAMRG